MYETVLVGTDGSPTATKAVEAAALTARQRAEEALRAKIDKIELAEAQAELIRAAAQLKLIQKLRKAKG